MGSVTASLAGSVVAGMAPEDPRESGGRNVGETNWGDILGLQKVVILQQLIWFNIKNVYISHSLTLFAGFYENPRCFFLLDFFSPSTLDSVFS